MLNRMLRPQLFHPAFSPVGARHVVPVSLPFSLVHSPPTSLFLVGARFIVPSSLRTSINSTPLHYHFSFRSPLATHHSPLPPHIKNVTSRNTLTQSPDVRLFPFSAREPSLPPATPAG